jgi:hypothetical protein
VPVALIVALLQCAWTLRATLGPSTCELSDAHALASPASIFTVYPWNVTTNSTLQQQCFAECPRFTTAMSVRADGSVHHTLAMGLFSVNATACHCATHRLTRREWCTLLKVRPTITRSFLDAMDQAGSYGPIDAGFSGLYNDLSLDVVKNRTTQGVVHASFCPANVIG